ncbi:MAG: UDP-2,3-diacylglucosamine diphosphatase [Bacteroidota bacterium]
MTWLPERLPEGKRLYFASDFHLGAPDKEKSRERERRIVRWLDAVAPDAQAIFLMGDLFDFWFEYRHVVPKGFIRLQGKLAQLADSGIQIVFFTGNHDMWMFDYFSDELGIPVYKDPKEFTINGKKFLIGHGDGLGPGDAVYKILKKIFANRTCQLLFGFLHPFMGMGIANAWSSRSRLHNNKKEGMVAVESEWLYTWCKEQEAKEHRNFYIFGHRHLPLDLPVGPESRYLNLGEWLNHFTYAVFDGENMALKTFEG